MAKVELKAIALSLRQRELILGVILALVAGATGYLLGRPLLGIISAIGIFTMAIAYQYPQLSLWLFLLYMPFAGTVTYNLGQGHGLFHLVKDIFYFPALIGLIHITKNTRSFRAIASPLKWPLLFLGAICLLCFLFTNLPAQIVLQRRAYPLLMGLVGFKTLFGYIPLIFCAYYLIRDRRSLLFFTRSHTVVILACCSLAFIQYLLLIHGICPGSQNLTGEHAVRASLGARCFVGGSLLFNPELSLIRLPGTFVAPWQWGWFLISGSFLAFAAGASDPKRLWRCLSLIAIALLVVMTVISGQRTALGFVPMILVFLQIFTTTHKKLQPFELGLAVFLVILLLSNLDKVQQQLDSFINRWNASPPPAFMMEQFIWVINNLNSWLGNGIGTATNSSRFFGYPRLIETYYAKVLYEIGPFGVLGVLALVTTLSYITFKAYRSLQDPNLRALGLCLWLFVLFISYFPYYYPLDVDPVAVYYWFFAGVLLKLPHLERGKKGVREEGN